MNNYKNKMIYFLLSVAFACLFVWIFSRTANWHEVYSLLKSSHCSPIVFAVIALFIDFSIRLYRWKYILSRHNPQITLSQCFTPYFASFALNNILPFRLGDVARAALFNAHLGVRIHPVVSSLMIERITDLVSLMALFFCSVLLLSIDIKSHVVFDYILLVSCLAIIAVATLFIFSKKILLLMDKVSAYLSRKQYTFAAAAISFIQKTINSFNMHVSYRDYSILLLAAFAAWIFEAITFACIASSMDIHLATAESFFVMSMATLSTLLPTTPGYVGTFEYLCKLSLNLVGVEENHAVASAILMHAVNLLPITLVGMAAFAIHFRLNTLRRIQDISSS